MKLSTSDKMSLMNAEKHVYRIQNDKIRRQLLMVINGALWNKKIIVKEAIK